MEKIKVTNEQVVNFRVNAERYIGTKPGVFSKFIYALNKVLKNTKALSDAYNEDVAEAKYDLASKDEKTKTILIDKDTNEFRFTSENRSKLDKDVKKILDKEVEVDCFQSTELPDDLTVSQLNVFCPFVVSEQYIENKFTEYGEKENKKEKTQ